MADDMPISRLTTPSTATLGERERRAEREGLRGCVIDPRLARLA